MTDNKLGLILLHPAMTNKPEDVTKAVEEAAQDGVQVGNQYLINKVNDGSVKLDADKYDVIHYLTPESPDSIKFPSKLVPTLYSALKAGGSLYGLSDVLKLDALINGFNIVSDGQYHWEKKVHTQAAVSIPLKTSTNNRNKLPSFKRAVKKPTNIVKFEDDLDDDDEVNNSDKAKFFTEYNNDEDSIEEEDLVREDLDQSGITMITCGKSKTRRKKACKDCSCGLKEEEEQEIDQARKQQDKVVKLTEDELTEIDFTVEGKKVGGCGSCSLGDAFRCSGCPYLGLPAFKPGQQINLSSVLDDL